MSLSKFESMLKTNNVYFFDTTEFEEIIQHYLNISKLSLAKKGIQLGLEQHPSSIVLKLLKVELFVFEDDLKQAAALLTEIEAVEPHNEEVFIQKATIASKKGKHKKALAFLKEALLFTKNEYDIWLMLGMEYLYIEEYKEARLYFAKCLEEDIEDYSSLYNIVYCFEIEESYNEAVNYLKLFLDKNPYSEVGWHQLGRQYIELKNYEKALEAFGYAVLIDESFIGGYLEKAKTHEKLKEYEEAIANYLITLKLDDPTAYVYIRIGKCYEKLGVLETAINYYKKATVEDPFLETAWVLLSDIYYKAENYPKAIHYMKEAIGIDELNTVLWRKYADINSKLGFYEEAVIAFNTCLSLGDNVIGVYVAAVDVLIFIGDFKAALNLLLTAKEAHKNFAEIEYRLCGLFYTMDDKENSFLHLKNGLILDYEYKNVIKDLFPIAFDSVEIQKIIADFKRVLK